MLGLVSRSPLHPSRVTFRISIKSPDKGEFTMSEESNNNLMGNE